MPPMVPCFECQRHVRIDEAACPFCGASSSDNSARITPDAPRRLARAAAFVFGASVAVAACGDTVVTDGSGGAGSTTASNGSSNPSATGVGGAGGSVSDGGGMQTLYGAPAVGGFGGEGSGGDGSGGFAAEYGAPPPPDD